MERQEGMDPIAWFVETVDPFLIAPYRWPDNPILGWWLGTFILAVWATILGEITLSVVYRVNRAKVVEVLTETSQRHEQSMNALRAGDKKAYKGINKLANEAFGKAFFLQLAMGMSSLWPAFLAAAWLQARFGEITWTLPRANVEIGFIAPFLGCYVLARILFIRSKKAWPALRRRLGSARTVNLPDRPGLPR